MTSQQDKVQLLVLDAGPLIKEGIKIKDYAENFITVPEVLSEVRDLQARKQLALFPYDIQVRTPSEDALRAVVTFSKKTGDFNALSSVDLKVLALTYMLEKEKCGIQHIRTQPVKPQLSFGGKLNQVIKQPLKESTQEEEEEIQDNSVEKNSEPKEEDLLKTKNDEEKADFTVNELTEDLKDLNLESNDNENKDLVESADNNVYQIIKDEEEEETEEERKEDDDDDDDDDGGWITPSNLKAKQREFMGANDDVMKEPPREVACITTDYAMQSILLQMNLGLVSLEGLAIKHIKSWVLRCHACFTIISQMDKKFCPKCGGGNTLNRVSCSIDKDGNFQYYLKKNYQYNLRGTKYSIPTFKGGHQNKDLILAEDSKEYQRAYKNHVHHKENDLFDPDFIPGILTGKQSNKSRAPVYGYGRKNPNTAKRRSGRKKS